MKRMVVALLALGMLTGSALAGAPTTAQKAEFHKVCMGIAQNDALCTCKAEAAMSLLDEAFMSVVLAGMKGKAPPEKDTVRYGQYIAQSNARCIPGY